MSAIEVVAAGPADRAAVADFIGQFYAAHDHHMDRDGLLGRPDDMIAINDVHFMVRAGRRIGHATLREMGDHVFVRHFVIDSAECGQGVGSAAFRALSARCFDGRQVRLDASHEIEGPRAFWEAQGFSIMGHAMRRNVEEGA